MRIGAFPAEKKHNMRVYGVDRLWSILFMDKIRLTTSSRHHFLEGVGIGGVGPLDSHDHLHFQPVIHSAGTAASVVASEIP